MRAKLLRITQTSFNSLAQRVIKMIGSRSTFTAEEYGPAGIDSNPVKDMTAVYLPTEADGDECVIGYLVKNKLSESGEIRIFSTDANNAFKFNVWLKADGTVLIGDSNTPADYTNFLVNFNELKTEFNALKTSYNNLVTTFNAHTHPYVNGVTPAVTSPTTTPGTANTSNIDNAKNAKIKSI